MSSSRAVRTSGDGSTFLRTLARPRPYGPGRLSTLLRFQLNKPRRMFLIVRGPLPSCRVVGVIPVRGRAGVNTVEFRTGVRGRTLERGIYVLTISPARRVRASDRPAAVKVVSTRRVVPVKEDVPSLDCENQFVPVDDRSLRSESSEAATAGRGPESGNSRGSIFRPPTAPGMEDVEQDEAMGLPLPGLGSVAGPGPGGGLESIAALAILALLGALLLSLVTLVARFLAGSWNP